jgi:hypothetical protein
VPGIKGVSDPKSLLFSDWPDRFFVAGKDPRIIEVETVMALAELRCPLRAGKKMSRENC